MYMAGGYAGKYALVDLSKKKTKIVTPDDAFYRKYLSGYGLGAAVIAELQKPGIDPLSKESHLGFCSGLLTGTGSYFSGRFMVVGKSPLTGGWGDANAGGSFSAELKRAGYDAVFFTGKSKEPVWVLVTEKGILFKSAKKLWGKDALVTEEAIRKELGDDKIQVASIGVSGEKLSLISGVVTDGGRIAARSGLGAVMGSKKLKALAVRGTQAVPVADKEKIRGINKRYLERFKKSYPHDRFTVKIMNTMSLLTARTGFTVPPQPSLVRELFRDYGTSGTTAYSAMTGDMPVKNWDGVGFKEFPIDRAAKTSDESVVARQKKRYACQSCPLGCGGIVEITKGRYAGTEGHKAEYETLAAFGGLLLHDDLDAIMELNELCNRAGIDTISAGGTVAFAIECYQRGIIDKKKTGGLELAWGDGTAIIKLTEMIIQRKGIGDILADGVKKAAERIGKGSEKYAMHAGGQELPMHDSRQDFGFGVAYQCEPTPGRHTISSFLYSNLYRTKKKFPAAARMMRRAGKGVAKKVALHAASSVYTQVMNGCGMCIFGAMTSNLPVVEWINAATGWDLTADELFTAGERILSMRKAFNVREGVLAADQRLPDRAAGRPPFAEGPLKGITADMDSMERTFFDLLGWDRVTGGPTKEKLRELGIDGLFGEY